MKYIYAEYFMVYLLSPFERLECPHQSCSVVGVEPGGRSLEPLPFHVDALFS